MSFDLSLDLTQLTNLVIQLKRDDIQTADALLVRITGDYIGSRMLARLLYWFPRSVKRGWVYKSWRDWGAEVGISPAQVKRIHQQGILEQVGIQRRLMKANGAPTTHYRLDTQNILQKIADFLEISLEKLHAMLTTTSTSQHKKRQRKQDKETHTDDAGTDLNEHKRDNLPKSPWLMNQPSLVERISMKTGLDVADLAKIDETHLGQVWRQFNTGIVVRTGFFDAYAISMNDLIWDAFCGVPMMDVVQEMSWRARQPKPEATPCREQYINLRNICLTHRRE